MKVNKSAAWRGDKEISPNGGTVVWKPTKKNHLLPTIETVVLRFYDSVGDCDSLTYIDQLHIESQKIKGNGYEKITKEEYEVVASMDTVSVMLSPNDTPFKREIAVTIFDGYSEGGVYVSVSQLPKSWPKE